VSPDRANPLEKSPDISVWAELPDETDERWEAAYVSFLTPARETARCVRRLRLLGAGKWPRDDRIVELFCGRGSGLEALERMGFTAIEGVDCSRSLLNHYSGRARLYLGDCRLLQLADSSRDAVIIQGGLHHLHDLPADIERVLGEVHRILRPHGKLLLVEPWLTPFLRTVHAACSLSYLCKLSRRLSALNEMIESEKVTYRRWLANKNPILALLGEYFATEVCWTALGKLAYRGGKR